MDERVLRGMIDEVWFYVPAHKRLAVTSSVGAVQVCGSTPALSLGLFALCSVCVWSDLMMRFFFFFFSIISFLWQQKVNTNRSSCVSSGVKGILRWILTFIPCLLIPEAGTAKPIHESLQRVGFWKFVKQWLFTVLMQLISRWIAMLAATNILLPISHCSFLHFLHRPAL